MNKKNKPKILFIDPFFSFYKRNTAGIAYLRGYLKDKGYDSSVVNLNRLVSDDLAQNFFDQVIDILDDSSKKDIVKNNLNKTQMSGEMFPLIHRLIYSLGLKKLWESIDKVNALNDVYKLISKKYSNIDYLCISITFPSQLFVSLAFSAYLKKVFDAKLKIVWGGNMVTGHIEEIKRILKYNNVVDCLVAGEGEAAIYSLIQEKKSLQIPNLFYLENGKYRNSLKQNCFEDAEVLSKPIYEKDDQVYIQATKECYWAKCSFCCYEKYSFSPRLNIKTPQKVVSEIIAINNQRMRDDEGYYFADPCLPVSFLEEFSKKVILESKIKNTFKTYMRCDRKIKFETLKSARNAGFSLFMLGIETLTPRLLKIIKKGQTRENVFEMIDNCHKLGIYLTLNFIVYLPTQTKKELIQDLEDIKEILQKYNNITAVYLAKFQVRPGSEISIYPEKFHIEILKSKNNFLSDNLQYRQIQNNSMTHEELSSEVWSFYDKYLAKYKKVSVFIPRK